MPSTIDNLQPKPVDPQTVLHLRQQYGVLLSQFSDEELYNTYLDWEKSDGTETLLEWLGVEG